MTSLTSLMTSPMTSPAPRGRWSGVDPGGEGTEREGRMQPGPPTPGRTSCSGSGRGAGPLLLGGRGGAKVRCSWKLPESCWAVRCPPPHGTQVCRPLWLHLEAGMGGNKGHVRAGPGEQKPRFCPVLRVSPSGSVKTHRNQPRPEPDERVLRRKHSARGRPPGFPGLPAQTPGERSRDPKAATGVQPPPHGPPFLLPPQRPAGQRGPGCD